MRKGIKLGIIFLLLINLFGCTNGDQHNTNTSLGSISLKVKWPVSGSNISVQSIPSSTQSIKVSVLLGWSNSQLLKEVIINRPDDSILIDDIPCSSEIWVQAKAYSLSNGTGEVLALGEQYPVTIIPNEVSNATINLKLNVDFSLTIGYIASIGNYISAYLNRETDGSVTSYYKDVCY